MLFNTRSKNKYGYYCGVNNIHMTCDSSIEVIAGILHYLSLDWSQPQSMKVVHHGNCHSPSWVVMQVTQMFNSVTHKHGIWLMTNLISNCSIFVCVNNSCLDVTNKHLHRLRVHSLEETHVPAYLQQI